MGHNPEAKRQSSIKKQIVTTTLLTVSLVMVTVSISTFFYFHVILRESIFKQQFTMVTEIADQLDRRIQLALHQLVLASTDINSTVLANPQKLNHVLENVSPLNMIFDAGLLIIGTNGRVIAESMGYENIIGTDLSERDYIREALSSGKIIISGPFNFIIPPYSPLVAVVIPVRDNNDKIICLLAGYHSLGTNQFLTSLSPKHFGDSSYLYIFHNRTILMHSDSSRIMDVIPEEKNRGIDMALSGLEGSLENINSKGVHLLSSFKRIGETGWIISANTPYDEAFRPIKKLVINSIILSVIGLLFALTVLWKVIQKLTDPIILLIDHVDAAVNNATAIDSLEWKPVKFDTHNEIERLANVFNNLMHEVQDTKALLKDEKDFFNDIIQNSSSPMMVIGHNHEILFWNIALSSLTGKSSGEMIGTNLQWTPFYDEKRPVLADLVIDGRIDRADELYENYSLSKINSCSLRAEGWYENIGGKRRYIFFEAAPVRNKRNEIIASVETLEDITDRKILEESLSRLTSAVEQSPVSIVITNLSGIIEYVNPNFCRVTGYSFEESIGQNSRILKSGEMSPENYSMLWSTILSGNVWNGEFHNKRKDGTLYWEAASISPLFDYKGTVSGYLAVKEDISRRKAMDAELSIVLAAQAENHEKLENLFAEVAHGKREWEETLDHLRDFIILVDDNNLIRRSNRMLADASGFSIKELIGMDWRNLMNDVGFEFIAFTGTYGELFHETSGCSYDISVYPVEHNDELTGYVISINDTTALRQATQELQKAYLELKDVQMHLLQQEKMASIGQLAAGVAHEINNPIGFVSSNLTTLNIYVDRLIEYIIAVECAIESCSYSEKDKLNNLRSKLKIDYISHDSRELVNESLDGTVRVMHIVQNLMSFSRTNQSDPSFVNLNDLLDESINFAGNQIKYIASISRDYSKIPDIYCVSQQLDQVFLNLLVNACHSMEGIQNGILAIRTWVEDNYVCVSVADSGCGISESNLIKIFDPFFTTKEVGKGTGLGLSISYEIVKKHGGVIDVESEVGKGTTFTVRLPVDAQNIEASG